MACLQCGKPKSIKAHLIPKAFVMEVKVDRGEQHLLIHQGKNKSRVTVTGLYDDKLLCGTCDGILGDHENYAYRLLKKIRQHKAPLGSIVSISQINGDKLVRFAAGIAWKYANTRPELGRIDIGPYSSHLAEVAFGKKEIPTAFDIVMFRLFESAGDTYFYRTPIPDHQDGVNIVRFTVGSVVFFLKIDKRNSGKLLPTECWLRGKTEGAFVLVPAETFEEGRIHRDLATNPSSLNFFRRMNEKSGI